MAQVRHRRWFAIRCHSDDNCIDLVGTLPVNFPVNGLLRSIRREASLHKIRLFHFLVKHKDHHDGSYNLYS